MKQFSTANHSHDSSSQNKQKVAKEQEAHQKHPIRRRKQHSGDVEGDPIGASLKARLRDDHVREGLLEVKASTSGLQFPGHHDGFPQICQW